MKRRGEMITLPPPPAPHPEEWRWKIKRFWADENRGSVLRGSAAEKVSGEEGVYFFHCVRPPENVLRAAFA